LQSFLNGRAADEYPARLWGWHAVDDYLIGSTQAIRPNRVAIEIGAFVKMLAKIAHCFAIAQYGLGGFRPLLPAFIRGRMTPAPLLSGDRLILSRGARMRTVCWPSACVSADGLTA
jgi:hypothetical protein